LDQRQDSSRSQKDRGKPGVASGRSNLERVTGWGEKSEAKTGCPHLKSWGKSGEPPVEVRKKMKERED